MIDYRELLRKYIQHVEYQEGANFIASLREPGNDEPTFTDEEVAALRELTDHDDYA